MREIKILCTCSCCKKRDFGFVHWFTSSDPGHAKYLYERDAHLHQLPRGWALVNINNTWVDVCDDCLKKNPNLQAGSLKDAFMDAASKLEEHKKDQT